MRKTDYLALAQTLRTQLNAARYADVTGRTSGAALIILETIQQTARNLRGVNRAEFLKLSGINPER